MKAQNHVFVVTGAGSGMGREIVLELLRRGARVAGVDLNPTTLAETAELARAGDSLATFTLNVSDRAAVEALPAKVVERFGAVDGVINCAGIIQPFVKLNELGYDAIARVFDVNFHGVLYMTKSFLPLLLDRPEAHVVNISSMGGFLPVPGQTAYGASKAAVKLLTEGLWAEMQGTPVHVTVVFPGGVATNITQNSGVTPPPMDAARQQAIPVYAADQAARDILDGMEADAFRVLVGNDAQMMDQFYRQDPQAATALIAEQMKELLVTA